MAFLVRCPRCDRPQRVDVLRGVELRAAGDVFTWCNTCDELFISFESAGIARARRLPTSEKTGYAIARFVARKNKFAEDLRRAERRAAGLGPGIPVPVDSLAPL